MKYPLPNSATDLLIEDGKLLMRSLSVYEVLRRFRHIIRLTPFKFEDFLAALSADEQSPLVAEIHIQLLRTLLREDRQQQTWLCPPDLRDAVNIYLQLADHATYPAALRIYLSADSKENSVILEKISGSKPKNYPLETSSESKLDVLEHLCDQFLLSNLARDEIVNGTNSTDKHDSICRLCSKANGDLIACENCPAVYHLKCSDPPLDHYPDEEDGEKAYVCSVCRSNHIVGVSDCIDPNEQSGNLKRLDALGLDSSNRCYWFLVRRLFVVDEKEEDVRYYTTYEQLEELLKNLHTDRNEKHLADALEEQREEMERQMKITHDLRKSLIKDYSVENGSSSNKCLGQDGAHKNYTNHYSTNNLALGKNQHSERDINRTLGNKFSMNSVNSFKWQGAIDGYLSTLTVTIKSTILKFEAMIPNTFLHPCWQTHKATWVRSINFAHGPEDYAVALSQLECCIKPVLFKSVWHDSVGFSQLFRSTLAEREELKKTDRQPRGFERREWFSQDFEQSYRLGTMVKFSSKLKPIKHQVWKQKGEEYRLTGLNGWLWRSCAYKSKSSEKQRPRKTDPFGHIKVKKEGEENEPAVKKCQIAKAKMPKCHDFLTKRTKMRSILVLPQMELHKLARSGGFKEAKSFSYTAKQNNYIWPYGMTPRPSFRTCWLYKNRIIDTIQDVALQLKVFYASIRWDDLQVRPPASGHNTITTDESTITVELLKKRDKLPYLTHSEYLIRKTVTPIEQPTKYRKVGIKKSTPSARSGLRARRQTEDEEEKGPTSEEVWVPEEQLELWELRQFDEKIERQNQLMRERALREEADRRRKVEEEKRRKAEQERRKRAEEQAKKARLAAQASTPPNSSIGSPNLLNSQGPRQNNSINIAQPRSLPTTPVLRYFRTEQGQIIRLPASYLQRGTPLILRHVGPGPNQTNTYIIRPQITPVTTSIVTSTPTTIATTVTTTPAAPSTITTKPSASTPSTAIDIKVIASSETNPADNSEVSEPPKTASTGDSGASESKETNSADDKRADTPPKTIPVSDTSVGAPSETTSASDTQTTTPPETIPTNDTKASEASETNSIGEVNVSALTETNATDGNATSIAATATTATTTSSTDTLDSVTEAETNADPPKTPALVKLESQDQGAGEQDSVGTVVNKMAHDQHAQST